jgi:hypothetical protein
MIQGNGRRIVEVFSIFDTGGILYRGLYRGENTTRKEKNKNKKSEIHVYGF